jgi:hypothetical protein
MGELAAEFATIRDGIQGQREGLTVATRKGPLPSPFTLWRFLHEPTGRQRFRCHRP